VNHRSRFFRIQHFSGSKSVRFALLAAALTLTGCSDDDPQDSEQPRLSGESLVLVHGAWNGAWVWDGVKERLESEGASVQTITLPAHADDSTPVSESSLASYVDSVLDLIEDGKPVTLVGHSFGGVVISLTAERKPEAVARLIYVGAFLPQDGDTALGLAQTDTESDLAAALEFDMERGVVGIQRDAFPQLFCADCSQSDLVTLGEKYSDEPLPPLVEPIRLSAAGLGSLPKYYVYTALDRVLSPSFQQRMTSGWELAGTRTLQTSHSPFFSAPDQLVATVAGIVHE